MDQGINIYAILMSVIASVVEVYVMVDIGASYLEKKQRISIKKQMVCLILGIFVLNVFQLLYFGMAGRLFLYGYLFQQMFREKRKTKILYTIGMIGLLLGVELLFTMGLKFLWKEAEISISFFIVRLFSLTVFLVLLKSGSFWWDENKNGKKLLGWLCFPAGCIFLFSTLTMVMVQSTTHQWMIYMVLIGEFLLLACLSVSLETHMEELKKVREVNKQKLSKQKAKQDVDHYIKIKSSKQEYDTLVQNSSYQLHRLLNYFSKKEYQLANDYLLNSRIKVNESQNEFYTEHEILNFILNEKKDMAKDENIQLMIDLKGYDFDFLSDLEICMLFQNLVDFSIQKQVEKEEVTEKNIYITAICLTEDGYFVINVSDVEYPPTEKKVAFPMKEKQGQEFLLYGAELVANHHGGNLKYQTEEGHFFITLLIKK